MLLLFTGLTACKIHKKPSRVEQNILLPPMVVHSRPSPSAPYQPMAARVMDLIHTELHLEFDYQKQQVPAIAKLTLKPYAQPLHEFNLDAKGFALRTVTAKQKGKDVPIRYQYDSVRITIYSERKLTVSDTIEVMIEYTARPNELPNEGGRAITDSRGLYFINPLGTDPNKPRQIWTQGEPKCNSAWFPTIDEPNEKHTQDIFLLVDTPDITLSNGLLVGSVRKGIKREDHWRQSLPHAPYLTMLAVGNFGVTKDQWRGKEVSYYLEPDFSPYARSIFGSTVNMLEVFSTVTGVPYPWEKFSQIVCRDFVSGAMENTSAVLHNEMVQHTERESIDQNQEGIIAHELFHHWFGDLVTARSWSNIALNESFATYGEYLYNEAAHGKTYADAHFGHNLEAYLRSKSKHQLSLFRPNYNDPDDVFDVVSYQKGSTILHYLRSELGDAIFFEGMRLYLTHNAFGAADFHDLRKAMEEASGRDLYSFFKQWFEGKGHPELVASVRLELNKTSAKQYVVVQQIQDSSFGVFDLKLKLLFASEDGSLTERTVQVNQRESVIPLQEELGKNIVYTGVWADPYGNIPAMIHDAKGAEDALRQLQVALKLNAVALAKRALRLMTSVKQKPSLQIQLAAAQSLLRHHDPVFQLMAFQLLNANTNLYESLEDTLKLLITQSHHQQVKNEAWDQVASNGNGPEQKSCLMRGLADSSYEVMSSCLQGLVRIDLNLALATCEKLEREPSNVIQRTIAWIYAANANDNRNYYFKTVLGKHRMLRHQLLNAYAQYLKQQKESVVREGLGILKAYYQQNSDRDKADRMQQVLLQLELSANAGWLSSDENFKQLKQWCNTK